MLAPVRKEAPDETPVSVPDAKLHLRVDHSEDDALIEAFIAAATEHLDGWTGTLGRAIVTQTWEQNYAGFSPELRLPLGPVDAVSSIQYFDADNASQTLPETEYTTLTDAAGTYIVPAVGKSWPSTYSRPIAVTVTYVAGLEADEVPAPIKTAILLMVALWYENREAATEASLSELPFGVKALLAPYRRVSL